MQHNSDFYQFLSNHLEVDTVSFFHCENGVLQHIGTEQCHCDDYVIYKLTILCQTRHI
jgi:hypothetical protein